MGPFRTDTHKKSPSDPNTTKHRELSSSSFSFQTLTTLLLWVFRNPCSETKTSGCSYHPRHSALRKNPLALRAHNGKMDTDSRRPAALTLGRRVTRLQRRIKKTAKAPAPSSRFFFLCSFAQEEESQVLGAVSIFLSPNNFLVKHTLEQHGHGAKHPSSSCLSAEVCSSAYRTELA